MEIGVHGNYTATHCSCCGEAFLVKGISAEGMVRAQRALQEHISQSDKCEEYYDKLPTLMDLRGVAPDCTGDLSSEEFVRKIRNGGQPHSPTPTANEKELVEKAVTAFKRGLFDNANIPEKTFDDAISACYRESLITLLSEVRRDGVDAATPDFGSAWTRIYQSFILTKKEGGKIYATLDMDELMELLRADYTAYSARISAQQAEIERLRGLCGEARPASNKVKRRK